MKLKRFGAALLACMLVFTLTAASVTAAPASNNSTGMMRVSGRLNHSIPANTIEPIDSKIDLAKGDTISFDCTYTPKYSSMDFGYIDSDNVFHFLNCTNGSIDLTVSVAKSGQYLLAIRNNEDYAVTVTGTIKY